jgi:hypothetical protein
MFPEAELAAGPEHAPDLGERPRRVGDAAEHERDDRRVEHAVREGQAGCVPRDDGHREGRRTRRALRQFAQVRIRLDGDERGHLRRVVAEARPGAGADLDDPAAESGDEVPPALRERRLRAADQAGEDAGEDGVCRLGGICSQPRRANAGPGPPATRPHEPRSASPAA